MDISGFVKLVDSVLLEKIGLTSADLPDIMFDNYFEEDMSMEELKDCAFECAMDILYDNGYTD